MEVILIMCLGALVGKFCFPRKWKRSNEILQIICTVLLIFSMGVILGGRENFLGEIKTLGYQSVLFFLIPSVLSVVFVYPLTRIFLEKRNMKNKEEKHAVSGSHSADGRNSVRRDGGGESAGDMDYVQ